jgi:tetratricopeptide (TPR) repeat protein
MKIAISAISKNEEQFVERFCESAKEADLILIADTGSSDNTVAKAKECGADVYNICISPWRFDHARNAAIALLPKDVDIVISLDLDEVLLPGWREEIEKVWTPETTRLRYMFDWGCGIKFQYEKIFARHGYYFWHPCHEYPRPDGRIEEVFAYTGKMLVKHLPDPTKSRGQYLDLLALSVKEDPVCPRNAFYYARELSFYGRWDDSITELKRYLELPGATWVNERAYAMRTLGKCYEGKEDFREAEAWLLRAAAEAPNSREPWCALSTIYYRMARWLESYTCALRALAIKDRELVYTVDPAVWGAQPYDLAAIAAWNMGMKDLAAEHGAKAVELEPENERLKENLLWFRGEKTVSQDD